MRLSPFIRTLDNLLRKDYTYTYEDGKLVRAAEGTVTLDGETVKGRTVQNKTVYTYGKDGQLKRKRISITNGSVYSEDYEYPEDGNMLVRYSYGNNILSHSKNDSFGRKLFDEIQFGKGVVSRQFAYHSGEKTEALAKKGRLKSSPVTSLVKTIIYDDGRTIEYEYDGEERITKVTDSIDGVTEYTYDELGQLLTEKHNGVTVNSMTYDNYGNIKTKNGVSYTYDSVWKDLLTKVGSQKITYDEQGNPTDYLGHTLTWEKGRQLKSFDTNTYTYNADGIRTGKQTQKLRRNLFITEGSKLVYEDRNWYGLVPLYDNEGNICGIRYYSENYFFQKNLQGDVISIKDSKGNTVARYRYDAWGVPTIVEDITPNDEEWEGDGIATVNPFRYRGYYYDNETGLYYLQSRYYDPNIGRFINADDPELCALSEIMPCGGNLYSYCLNNPILGYDIDGYYDRSAAVYYALKWYNKRNPEYCSSASDCANFVSQCLFAGGIKMTRQWHSYPPKKRYIPAMLAMPIMYVRGVTWDVTDSWVGAISQFKYFFYSPKSAGWITGIYSSKDIANALAKYKIKKGDLIYWAYPQKGIHHVGIIVDINYRLKKIYYSAHTKSRWRYDLSLAVSKNDYANILRLKDSAK